MCVLCILVRKVDEQALERQLQVQACCGLTGNGIVGTQQREEHNREKCFQLSLAATLTIAGVVGSGNVAGETVALVCPLDGVNAHGRGGVAIIGTLEALAVALRAAQTR